MNRDKSVDVEKIAMGDIKQELSEYADAVIIANVDGVWVEVKSFRPYYEDIGYDVTPCVMQHIIDLTVAIPDEQEVWVVTQEETIEEQIYDQLRNLISNSLADGKITELQHDQMHEFIFAINPYRED